MDALTVDHQWCQKGLTTPSAETEPTEHDEKYDDKNDPTGCTHKASSIAGTVIEYPVSEPRKPAQAI